MYDAKDSAVLAMAAVAIASVSGAGRMKCAPTQAARNCRRTLTKLIASAPAMMMVSRRELRKSRNAGGPCSRARNRVNAGSRAPPKALARPVAIPVGRAVLA